MKTISWLLCGSMIGISGCGLQSKGDVELPIVRATPTPRPLVPSPVTFSNITRASGLTWKHNNGAFGLKLLPETMGAGVAFLDCDGDGLQDIFLVNGRDWSAAEIAAYRQGTYPEHHKTYGFVAPTPPPPRRTVGALYRNNGDGTFTDITRNSGLDIEMYGMGVAVGDYDNDGRVDLYVTALGHNYLFRNQSSGVGKSAKVRFAEVGATAGVRDSGFGSSAAWLDFDRDGRLDLFVCRYIDWKPATDIYATFSKNIALKDYSTPVPYNGQRSHLYRNLGGGRFADVTQKVGIQVRPYGASPADISAAKIMGSGDDTRTPAQKVQEALAARREETRLGKAMGVTICDPNNDGWPDILVANDEVPNSFFLNQQGHFSEIAGKSGLALSASGERRAGMGIDSGDIDRSGRDSVLIGNFADENLALYYNEGQGLFNDIAAPSEVAGISRASVTFGCLLLDIDNDGWLDILAANGHVAQNIADSRRDLSYPQRALLYLNRRQKQPVKFDEIGLQSGAALSQPRVARGLASADIDLDGDLDLLFTTNGGPPVLLRNDLKPTAHAHGVLRLSLQGTRSNRSAIGAKVEIELQNNSGRQETLHRTVKSGASYLSQNELPLTIGLGAQHSIRKLTIFWPAGGRTVLSNLKANSSLVVREAQGVVSQTPLRRPAH